MFVFSIFRLASLAECLHSVPKVHPREWRNITWNLVRKLQGPATNPTQEQVSCALSYIACMVCAKNRYIGGNARILDLSKLQFWFTGEFSWSVVMGN